MPETCAWITGLTLSGTHCAIKTPLLAVEVWKEPRRI
jgi:hypothetical protein